MRWKFVFDETAVEAAQRALVKQRVAEWWQAFAARTEDLAALFSRKKNWDLPAWMNKHLNAISKELMWEFGPGLLGGHRLVITPETSRHLRPLVSEILASAPRIANWEFYSYRLPEGYEQAKLTVEAKGGRLLSEMRFVLTPGKFNRIDIRCLVMPDCPADLARKTGFIAIETLLGEEMLDRWVGLIDHETTPQFPPEAVNAIDMLGKFRGAITQIVTSLPSEPWLGRTSGCEWSLFKLKPNQRIEYPGRQDQLTQTTAFPELHRCLLNGVPFESARFSRCGETFAYVKIDGAEGVPSWGFKDRKDIEKSLLSALEAAGVGTMIGGGNGLRYCYVDLALLDVPKAIPCIRQALARGGVSTRSWLLFADRDYCAEWIGIFPESPAPPMTTNDNNDSQ